MAIALSLICLALSLSAGASPLSTSSASARQTAALTLAPLVQPGAAHEPIDNSYIVVLKPGASSGLLNAHVNMAQGVHAADATASALEGLGSGLRHIFDSKLKGYSGVFSDATITHIRTLPEVAYVEQDQVVHAYNYTRQLSAPWGLSRISHRGRPTLSTFGKYEYDSDGGDGVDVYVIDTGINIKHEEFQGRAFWGKTIPGGATDSDGNGHGTHCAGTIASRKFGVAKKAHVYAVKVLGDNGSGSMSDVMAGVTWAADAAADKMNASRAEYAATGKTSHKGSVANMSLGGGKSPTLDEIVNAAVENGVHFAVAAGNDNRDACDYSPAAAELAITTGASTIDDERASFSNHGPCVDVFAPGLKIISTWTGSVDAVNTISGTSMASPHVAGLLAYFLSLYSDGKFMPEPEEGDAAMLPAFATVQGVLGAAQAAAVPSWLGAYLPHWMTRRQTAMPPPPKKPTPPTISPAQLKKVVLSLATRNALAELPPKTVNLLIYNNITAA